MWFAATYGITGLLGAYCGGEWASRYAANNKRLQLRAVAMTYSMLAGCMAAVYLTKSYYLTFGLMGLVGLTGSVLYGPVFATLQTLAPPEKACNIDRIRLFANQSDRWWIWSAGSGSVK